MAVKDRSTLQAEIVAQILANGNNAITGPILQTILLDVTDSLLSQLDDSNFFSGLAEYDVSKSYAQGEGVIYQNAIYQSSEAISPSAFDPTKWTKLSEINDPAVNFDFVPWDNLTTYNIDDRVSYQNKLFKCDQNGTLGVIPIDSAPEWTEVSASDGTFGQDWATGTYYLQNDVVTYNAKLYYLTTATTPSTPVYSTSDPVTDTANWSQFNTTPQGGIDIEIKTFPTDDGFTSASGKTYFIDTSGGAMTTQLPAPVLNAVFKYKVIDASNPFILLRNGGENIEFVAENYTVTGLGDAFTLISDGTDWFVI